MDSVPDLNAGKDKWMARILVVLGTAVVLGGGYAGYRYLTYKPGGSGCSRIAEIGKSDTAGAHAVVEQMVHYVESHVVRGRDPVRIGGDDDTDRCNEALKVMEDVLMHGRFTRMVECMASARDAQAAGLCI